VAGKFFVYKILDVPNEGDVVAVEYKNQVISKGGDQFILYDEGTEHKVSFSAPYAHGLFFIFHFLNHFFIWWKSFDIKSHTVSKAHELWVHANSRSNTRKQAERERVSLEQQVEAVLTEPDYSNINALFVKMGRGPHLLEMEFEPTSALSNILALKLVIHAIVGNGDTRLQGRK
jgi:hypothetical protein